MARPCCQSHSHADHRSRFGSPGQSVGDGERGRRTASHRHRESHGVLRFASDVRLSAATQIESVGGRFIRVDGMEDHEDASGYAKPLSEEVLAQLNEAVANEAERSDLIITSARIFGQKPPQTLSVAVVERCQADTVIVDLNADIGGNCALTVPGVVVRPNGVKIVGEEHLARRIPKNRVLCQQRHRTAVFALQRRHTGLGRGQPHPDRSPRRRSTARARHGRRGGLPQRERSPPTHPTARSFAMIDPSLFLLNLTLFVLAIFLGVELITKVPPHTPL